MAGELGDYSGEHFEIPCDFLDGISKFQLSFHPLKCIQERPPWFISRGGIDARTVMGVPGNHLGTTLRSFCDLWMELTQSCVDSPAALLRFAMPALVAHPELAEFSVNSVSSWWPLDVKLTSAGANKKLSSE